MTEDNEFIEYIARAIATSDGVPEDAPLGDYLRNGRAVAEALTAYRNHEVEL